MVVVIDVLRAFTTAAYAFGAGAQQIIVTSTVDEAIKLRYRFSDSLIMGEVDGLQVPDFDLSNSPVQISQHDLQAKLLIQRTSAGTQGLVRSQGAEHLFAASFVVAKATVHTIQQISPTEVSFVLTGFSPGSRYIPGKIDSTLFGDEDAACAEYIARILLGEQPEAQVYLKRVYDSRAGKIFADPNRPELPASDLGLCTALDRFDFAMRVERNAEMLVMRPHWSI